MLSLHFVSSHLSGLFSNPLWWCTEANAPKPQCRSNTFGGDPAYSSFELRFLTLRHYHGCILIKLGCNCHITGYSNKQPTYPGRLCVHLKEPIRRVDSSLIVRIMKSALVQRIINKGETLKDKAFTSFSILSQLYTDTINKYEFPSLSCLSI